MEHQKECRKEFRANSGNIQIILKVKNCFETNKFTFVDFEKMDRIRD